MSELYLPPSNPAELVSSTAMNIMNEPQAFEDQPDAMPIIVKLDEEATALNFTEQQYFVQTSRGLSIPASLEPKPNSGDTTISYKSFYKLSFEGIFRGYSRVAIGKIVGGSSVRAYCLAFEEVTLLPFLDSLPEDHIFHVPALAVDAIDQTS